MIRGLSCISLLFDILNRFRGSGGVEKKRAREARKRLELLKSVFWSSALNLGRRFWYLRSEQFEDLYYALPNSLLEVLTCSSFLVIGFAPLDFRLIFRIGSGDRPFIGLDACLLSTCDS